MIAKPDETAAERGERRMDELARMRAERVASGWTPAAAAAWRAADRRMREQYPNQCVAYREKWSADRAAVELEVLAFGPSAVAVSEELDRLDPDHRWTDVQIDYYMVLPPGTSYLGGISLLGRPRSEG